MSSGCGDVLSLADLQTAKKHQIFEAEVITGKQGGVAGGADIDYATNQVTGQTQKTLPAVLRDSGFSPVSWDFSTGGTLTATDRDKVVYDPVSKTWYSYAGALPVTVPAGFNPVGNADWRPWTDPTLREWAENRFQTKAFVPVQGASFTTGGTLSSLNDAMYDSSTQMYWASSVTPKTVTPGLDPRSDADFYPVGKLSPLYQINDSRNWYEPSSTVDNSTAMQLFLSAMTRWGMEAVIVGDVLTSTRVQCDCDIDAANCDWYISPDFDSTGVGGAGAVLVIRDVDTVETSGNSFATSNIGQTSHVQLSSAAYSNCTVGVEGEGDVNRAYLRNGSSYINAFDLYVMDGGTTGFHPDTPALFKFNGTSKFTVRPLRPLRSIKGANFIMEAPLSGSRVLRACIKIERNNTTLDGGCFNAQANNVLAESYVEPRFVTQCTVKNVTMPSSQTPVATYTIQAFCTNRLTVQNCHAPAGWALVDGNFMRNTVVEDCSGATIGCHAMAWNFTVNRCALHPVIVAGKYQGGVGLTGGGLLSINDLTYTYMGGERALDHPVATRGDYGQAWEGDILIDNINVTYAALPASGQALALLYMQGAGQGSIDLTRDCFLGKRINIKNIRINIANASWSASDVIFNTVFFQTTGTQTVRYPSEYNVENLEVYKSSIPTSDFTMDPRWPLVVAGDYVPSSNCKMVFKNIRWPSVSVGFIGPAAGVTYKVTPELIIQDGNGTFYCNQLAIPAGKITIRGTRIGNLTLGNAQGNGRYFIDQCEIAGKCGGSPGSSDRAYYTQCHTSVASVEVGSIAKYCHGNTVPVGGSVSGRSVDEWYSYRDPSVFRTA